MTHQNDDPGQHDMAALRSELEGTIGFRPRFGRTEYPVDLTSLEQLCATIVDEQGYHPYAARPNVLGGVTVIHVPDTSNPGDRWVYHYDPRGFMESVEAWYVGPQNQQAYPDPRDGRSRPIDHFAETYRIDGHGDLQGYQVSVHFTDNTAVTGDTIILSQRLVDGAVVTVPFTAPAE